MAERDGGMEVAASFVPAPDVIDRFLDRAAETPSHPAVATRTGSVSYGELGTLARRFATGLVRHPAPRVLIALPHGAEAYAAMFAAGLAGGYYVPVNLAAPADKLRRILRRAEPDLILCDTATLAPDLAAAIRAEAAPERILDAGALRNLPPFPGRGTRHAIAYVIFTSGSTGEPKGVVLARAALDRYAEWAVDTLGLNPADRVSQYANIGFDLSVLEIYGALCSGATLCPVTGAGDRLMPARLIRDLRITVWVSVPSVASIIASARQAEAAFLSTVRLFFFCGEPLLREQVACVFAACPEATVMNAYGPTEATVSVTALALKAGTCAAHCAHSVALGTPILGTRLYLVGGRDENEGEIVIAGGQLALGYWRDPARTAQAFRTFTAEGRALRGYFTGDWAERRNGELHFKERIDHQVKVKGFRLELDEVAAAIRACGWPVVCVFKRGEALAAVVEAQEGVAFDAEALRAMLATRLEAYAVPAEIRAIPAMPRNANDKLDRNAVAAWFEGVADGAAALTP